MTVAIFVQMCVLRNHGRKRPFVKRSLAILGQNLALELDLVNEGDEGIQTCDRQYYGLPGFTTFGLWLDAVLPGPGAAGNHPEHGGQLDV